MRFHELIDAVASEVLGGMSPGLFEHCHSWARIKLVIKAMEEKGYLWCLEVKGLRYQCRFVSASEPDLVSGQSVADFRHFDWAVMQAALNVLSQKKDKS